MLQRLFLAGLIAIGLSLPSIAADARQRIEMQLADRAALEKIELEVSTPASTRVERRPVTDLALDVWTTGPGIEPLLALPNGQAPKGGRIVFKARAVVVSAGRLHTGAVASCGPWEGDIAVCTLDCDGGRFGLRRGGDTGTSGLKVLIGTLPRDIDTGERPGFVISACGLEADAEVRLVPKPGRPLVEIAFTPDTAGN